MMQEIFNNAEGIGLYPVISLVLFIAFFVGVIIWVIKMKKSLISDMSFLPLEETNNDNFKSNIHDK